MATYGTSANGIEGDPAKINVAQPEPVHARSRPPSSTSCTSPTRARCGRASPRESNLPADTGDGLRARPSASATRSSCSRTSTSCSGARRSRTTSRSITGKHTIKVGGEWMHTLNDQVFRGFFTGRYLFDSVDRLPALRVAGGAGRLRSAHAVGCSNGTYVTLPAPCPAGTTATGGPLLLLSAGRGPHRAWPPTRRAPRTSPTTSSRCSSRTSGRSTPELHAQLRPALGRAADAGDGRSRRTTAYAPFLNDPRFPSDGTIPDQKKQFQPRARLRLGRAGQPASRCSRASAGIYYARQNMLTQVGSVTTNGLQQQSIFRSTRRRSAFADMPVWPSVLTPAAAAGRARSR